MPSQQNWLRSYMLSSYFWSGASPNPEPAAYDTVQKYFDALRFAGDGTVPKDRWSYISDSASYSQFFGEGKTLGYGLFVNGLELKLPLKARFIEAQSTRCVYLPRYRHYCAPYFGRTVTCFAASDTATTSRPGGG